MVDVVAVTKTPEDVCELFDKILTPREINDVARRLAVIELLEAGQSYVEISMRLGMGSNTISKISAKLGYGFRRGESGTASRNNESTKRLRIVQSKIKYKGAPTYTVVYK